jgi:hypothetical protein
MSKADQFRQYAEEAMRWATNGKPRNVINQTSQSLPSFALLAVSKTLMTDRSDERIA